MGFNSAFKGLKLLKKTAGNGRLNNLNDPVLNVLMKGNLRRKILFLMTQQSSSGTGRLRYQGFMITLRHITLGTNPLYE